MNDKPKEIEEHAYTKKQMLMSEIDIKRILNLKENDKECIEKE